MPCSVRSTSTQPVKRFSLFHVDSPWRMSTSLYMMSVRSVGWKLNGEAGRDVAAPGSEWCRFCPATHFFATRPIGRGQCDIRLFYNGGIVRIFRLNLLIFPPSYLSI